MEGERLDQIGLDVVIPSYRADYTFLKNIFELSPPDYVDVSYILVIDNPDIEISSQLEDLTKQHNVTVKVNVTNLGAGGARNVGIEAASKDWLLFLDDDIYPQPDLLKIYGKKIIQAEPSVIGFFGVTRFPDAINSFTKGCLVSDILTFFPIAEDVKTSCWAVTSNLAIRRSSLDQSRFQSIFPKFGGGEDIDFCLQIVKQSDQQFHAVPEAVVHHPWWIQGKRSYTRFQRWAFGDSRLPQLHPEHKYRNVPNVVESMFLSLIIFSIYAAVSGNYQILALVLLGIAIGEYVGEYSKLIINGKTKSPILALESTLIRASNDFGRIKGSLQRGHIFGITERFDYFCNGLHIRNERKWAMVKIIFMITSILGLMIT